MLRRRGILFSGFYAVFHYLHSIVAFGIVCRGHFVAAFVIVPESRRISICTMKEEKKEDACVKVMSSSPCFSMGIIADIQFADIPDGHSYSGQPRYYRHSLEVARYAFEQFQESKVGLVVNLGDIIDGKAQAMHEHGGEKLGDEHDPGHYSLDLVLDALSVYTHGPILHSYGNHCLYNLDRQTLNERLGIPFQVENDGEAEWVGYYSHRIEMLGNGKSSLSSMRLIFLDAYDVAMMQRCPETSRKHQEAVEILKQNNPYNFADGNINSPEGLDGLQRRFVAFNGALGTRQLEWLRKELEHSRRANEKVIIMSHNPIHPDSSSPICLIWNFDEVLGILRDFSDVVVASFSGHAHKGGYVRDLESGIHFRVFEAVLESQPEKTFAVIDFCRGLGNDSENAADEKSRLVVRGFGNCESAVYDFDHTAQTGRSDSSSVE
jgi:manganese-dependent ADP-ribose/CDP-alcohol diphosphatase